MSFRRKIVVVMALGVLLLIIQMVALGFLGSQRSQVLTPWDREGPDDHIRVDQRTLNLELHQVHENPASTQREDSPSLKHHPSLGNILEHPSLQKLHANSSSQTSKHLHHSTTPTPTSKKKVFPVARDISSIAALQPVPQHIWNCDISTNKEAMSAIGRAKSQPCRELIHNVTCLHKYKMLYDTEIKNTCPLGSNPGTGVEGIPFKYSGNGLLARVVFLFSMHGRAVRQVKRLFKAIYHVDHYYYIHVDTRSDYLHRMLYEELSDYPNVYFPTWRMATIWGGASLLQMILSTMADLEYILTDWHWDYLINLSESDFPVRTNNELADFLRTYRGMNFVKIHGGELNKFILKQGLDRTFVECDSHMWRVGTRSLPRAISVDGGSDWIAIHRNYSRYLIVGKDPLLLGLKRYYQYSLLPAESFFHTVLRNGPMCWSFVKTNLRMTNWNRKLGCLCQYKKVVDWCGCSPNNFLSKDITRLKALSARGHHFFARKFEAIVNQEVIEQLDAHLYGSLHPSTPGLHSYWESLFHMDDDLAKPSDARFTTFQSFLRSSLRLLYAKLNNRTIGGADCDIPKQAVVKEVSVYRNQDQFGGLVVSIRDALSEMMDPPEFELLFTPISHYRKFNIHGEVGQRIWQLEVGSDWDGKESIFRNHAGILGPWDKPVVILRLTSGPKNSIDILWLDPLGVSVSSHSVALEENWFVTYHTPKLDQPIRPGVWTVKVTMKNYGRPLLMQVNFLVVPLTHMDMKVMEFPQKVNAMKLATQGKEALPVFAAWKMNVTKVGSNLEEWVDDLVGKYWSLESYCRSNAKEGVMPSKESSCVWFPDCASTSWSTLSPDPKSELPSLTEVGADGRIR